MSKCLPYVSVLTPAYNEEKYLAQCIESVLNQKYQNFEYIIVNNCSTDSTLEIAKHYEKRDKRIKVISNQVFLTQAQNFNFALQQISPDSKYCKMVQGDDFIFPQCLTEMVNLAESNPSVGIVSSYRLNGSKIENDGLPYPSTLVPGREICRLQLLKGLFVFGTPTSILVRASIVRNRTPFFKEDCLHSDTEACYELLETWDLGFVHQVLSYSRADNVSITSLSQRFNPEIIDYFVVVKKYGPLYLQPGEFEQRYKEIKEHYYAFLVQSALRWRGRAFWKYHTSGLATAGCRLSKGLLLKYAFLALLDLIGNPKYSLTRIGRLCRRMLARKVYDDENGREHGQELQKHFRIEGL